MLTNYLPMKNLLSTLRVTCLSLVLGAGPLLATPVRAQELYEITSGSVAHDRRDVAALKLQVDGTLAQTRDFWQQFMKETYNLRFKGSTLARLGVGKNDELTVEQVSGIGISSRPVNLFVSFGSPTDSTTEVALFGAFGEKTYFEPGRTVPEFKGMTKILERFATAARVNAYRQQVSDAEASVAAIDKEKAKLQRNIQSAQSNTASNLKRIDELLRQNQGNATQMHQDSTQLTANGQLRETAQQQLQRRRDRLNTMAPK